MLKAAIVGLGWWGGTLVDAVEGSADIKFVGASTRRKTPDDLAFAQSHNLTFFDTYDALLASKDVDAVVLATPPAGHRDQIVAAARAGKHVFCEKPLAMSRAEAADAVAAVQAAGVTIGVGYNRRFHPSWLDLKRRIQTGELGAILHAECTMSGPNGLTMAQEAWRAQADQAPLGGLFPMGVHAIDGFIDLFGDIDQVFCQSMHRASVVENDDTTSILFRMKSGPSAYLAVMMATVGSFRFQVYGSKASAILGGAVHVAGQSSHQRRAGLFGSYIIQPVKGEAQSIDVPEFDVNRAELEAFAKAAAGGPPYPISHTQMINAVAATDAIIASARSGQPRWWLDDAMKITRFAEAKPYDPPDHFGVTALRLQGKDATPARLCVVGLSHFQPDAIAKMSASAEEKIYVVLEGEITVELAAGGRHVLARHDSCLIEPGEMREVRNESGKVASLLVLMPA